MAKGGGGEKGEAKFMKLKRIWKEHNNETQWQMKLIHRESEMIWSMFLDPQYLDNIR